MDPVSDARARLLGSWRISEMEVWGSDYLHLVVPAHITFNADGQGSFQFGTVRGWIDYRITTDGAASKVEFSWEGFNDSDQACGRGWGTIVDEQLVGRLFIHNSDDSGFVAHRVTAGPSRGPRRTPRRR